MSILRSRYRRRDGQHRPASRTRSQAAHRSGRARRGGRLGILGTLVAIALSVAACGGSANTSPTTTSSGTSATAGGSDKAITVSARTVGGLGTVLVDGENRTLYLLTSDKVGGTTRVTCTRASGCAAAWPGFELPAGAARADAGHGVQQSLLGTTKGSDGKRYVTYAGWPLYTYAGDDSPGQANGEGIRSFGGTWYALTPSGAAAHASTNTGGTTSTTGATQGGYSRY